MRYVCNMEKYAIIVSAKEVKNLIVVIINYQNKFIEIR